MHRPRIEKNWNFVKVFFPLSLLLCMYIHMYIHVYSQEACIVTVCGVISKMIWFTTTVLSYKYSLCSKNEQWKNFAHKATCTYMYMHSTCIYLLYMCILLRAHTYIWNKQNSCYMHCFATTSCVVLYRLLYATAVYRWISKLEKILWPTHAVVYTLVHACGKNVFSNLLI